MLTTPTRAATGSPTSTVLGLLKRPVVAGLLLLLVYGCLSLLNDSAGSLGTDTGTKVATLKVMGERDSLRPDIGYWAAEWDPDATYHGWLDTRHTDDIYVDVTTLPMIVAAYPLWQLGGYRLALLWPMVGAVAASFVARGFERRLRDGSDGWAAFWLIGLASPLLIYALDLWEHSLGVACMAGACLLLYDAVEGRSRRWHGLAAGALFGFAYSMRSEALVYVVTSFGIVGVVLLWRRRVVPALVVGATGVAGFAVATVLNMGLEILLTGQTYRFGHSAQTASNAGAGEVGLAVRGREALATSLTPFPSFESQYLVIAVVLGAALVVLALVADRPARRVGAYAVAGVVVVIYLYRASFGLGFVPGLLAATPLAAVGLARGWQDHRRRLVTCLAVVPLPIVFLTQFPGGALPQWAGRYILTSGFLLAVVGISSLVDLERWARATFVVLAACTSIFALLWLSSRTHQVAVAGDALNARPEQVLISPEGFPPREFAATYGAKPWLAVHTDAELPAAVDVVARSGLDSFAIVDQSSTRPLPEFPGFHRTGRTTVPFLDPSTFTVTSYQRDGT